MTQAIDPEKDPSLAPEPDVRDARYGPHEKHTFDFWFADGESPAPLFLYIHGGGFHAGRKEGFFMPTIVQACLDLGISVASINYRLSGDAIYPAHRDDCVRALQHLRYHAEAWRIDPQRIAAGGGSAGSGLAQLLGYRSDLADPDSDDPIARQPTHLRAVAAINMQCTYHPWDVKQIVPGVAYNNVALKRLIGLPDDWDWDTQGIPDEADRLLRDVSPLTHLTTEAPPVWIFSQEKTRVEGNIHHPNLGDHLKTHLDKLGVPNERRLSTDFNSRPEAAEALAQFLTQHLA